MEFDPKLVWQWKFLEPWDKHIDEDYCWSPYREWVIEKYDKVDVLLIGESGCSLSKQCAKILNKFPNLKYERVDMDLIHPAERPMIRKCLYGFDEVFIPQMFLFDKRLGIVELKDLSKPDSVLFNWFN